MANEIKNEKNGQLHFSMVIVVVMQRKNLSALMKQRLSSQMNIYPNMQKTILISHLVGMKNTPKKNIKNILKNVVMILQKVRKKNNETR